MANTGLIVFLPVVSAFVGAIIGAWANSWYRNREAKKARDEEREGLLILLSIEVATNSQTLQGFSERLAAHPDIDERASAAANFVAANLSSAVWDESRAKLAPLLPRMFVATVSLHYRDIEDVRLHWTGPYGGFSERDTERIRSIREDGIAVIQATQRYISDPRFSAALLKDEDV